MNSSAREQRLQEILHAYLQALDRGEQPARQALLDAHPELRDELAAYFADESKLRRLAQALATQNFAPADKALTLDSLSGAAPGAQLPRLRYFGDYELLEEIARGGMGVVFKARQVSLNRIVALKMILKGELATEADVRRFHQEAEAAGNLDHPNIVPIYEVGEHEGQQYFSMKLIEGPTIADGGLRIADFWQRQRWIAQLVATVARAVHHAHQRGILHRDLKPSNILLDAASESAIRNPPSAIPMITDFGLAKRLEGDDGPTHTGAIVGTPSYMAPEQAQAVKPLTTAVDVYSLGAVFYQLLTGRPPFQSDDPIKTLLKVVSEEPATPRSLDDELDHDLQTICLKCLEKEPAKRYGSAELLAEDLERWLRGEPIHARAVSTLERSWRWCRRNPALALTSTLALVAVSAVLGLTVAAELRERQQQLQSERQARERDKHEQLQEREREKREQLQERERLRESLLEQARAERLAGSRARSLDALRQALDIRVDDLLRLEATQSLMRPGLRPLAQLTVGDFSGTSWHAFSSQPQVRADGQLAAVYYQRQGEGIDLHALPSGKRVGSKRAKSGEPGFLAVGFRPGTTQLGLMRPGQDLVLWDYETDREVEVFAEPALEMAAFSKGGSYLLLKTARNIRIRNLSQQRDEKAPLLGEVQGFLSDHELLLLDQDRCWVWDCRNGQVKAATPEGLRVLSAKGHRGVGISAAAGLAALHGRWPENAAATVHIWDLKQAKQVGTIPGFPEEPWRIDICANGRFVAFDQPGERPAEVRIWDLALARFMAPLRCPRGFQLDAEQPTYTCNPDGTLFARRLVATGAPRTSLCIWDTTSGEVLLKVPHEGSIHWSNDGGRLTLTNAYSIHCWEVTTPARTYELDQSILSLSANRAGDRLAVNEFTCRVKQAGAACALVEWSACPAEPPWGRPIPHFVGQDEVWGLLKMHLVNPQLDAPVFAASIVSLFAAPSGVEPFLAYAQLYPRTVMLSPPRSNQTALLQCAPHERKTVLPTLDYPDHAQRFNEEERTLRTALQQPPRSFQLDDVATSQWAFAPEAPLLLRVGQVRFIGVRQPWETDQSVRGLDVLELWNYRAGKRLAILGMSALCFQFSPDGQRLALSRITNVNTQGELEIWTTEPLRRETVLQQQAVDALQYSSDGRLLMAVKTAAYARLLEARSGRQLHQWQIAKGEWQAFALSPDGNQIASAGTDRLIHLWDVATGRERARWQAHDGGVTALLYSRDGQFLYSGSVDGTLRLWNLSVLNKELVALGLDGQRSP